MMLELSIFGAKNGHKMYLCKSIATTGSLKKVYKAEIIDSLR